MNTRQTEIILEITNNTNDCFGAPLYITGDFNKWDSQGLYLGKVPPEGGTQKFRLKEIGWNTAEFKLSRGSWETLTCQSDGRLLPPYSLYTKHTPVKITIEGWRDQHPLSTASPQVRLLDKAFYFPHLDTHKCIWIYLPPDYHSTTKNYPVLYMHDGQQLFDEATAMGKKGPVEWRVDKTINTSTHKAIVIGIAGGQNREVRKREYLVHPNREIPKPQGLIYLKDIAKVLKPYVDQHFRTNPTPAQTAMAGSSLGGLLTLYAGLYYPDVFGSLGILSPSIWLDDKKKLRKSTSELLTQRTKNQNQHYFFYGGELEERPSPAPEVNMSKNIRAYVLQLKTYGSLDVELTINPTGKHGALYWQRIFPEFYDWWNSHLFPKTFIN